MLASSPFGLAVASAAALLPARADSPVEPGWSSLNRCAMTAPAALEGVMPADGAPVPPDLGISFTFASDQAVVESLEPDTRRSRFRPSGRAVAGGRD
jgi:hypothetical protein